MDRKTTISGVLLSCAMALCASSSAMAQKAPGCANTVSQDVVALVQKGGISKLVFGDGVSLPVAENAVVEGRHCVDDKQFKGDQRTLRGIMMAICQGAGIELPVYVDGVRTSVTMVDRDFIKVPGFCRATPKAMGLE